MMLRNKFSLSLNGDWAAEAAIFLQELFLPEPVSPVGGEPYEVLPHGSCGLWGEPSSHGVWKEAAGAERLFAAGEEVPSCDGGDDGRP